MRICRCHSDNVPVPQLSQKDLPGKYGNVISCFSFKSITANSGKILNISFFLQGPDTFEVLVLYRCCAFYLNSPLIAQDQVYFKLGGGSPIAHLNVFSRIGQKGPHLQQDKMLKCLAEQLRAFHDFTPFCQRICYADIKKVRIRLYI